MLVTKDFYAGKLCRLGYKHTLGYGYPCPGLLSYEEMQVDREEKDTQGDEFDPISDHEEDDEENSIQIQPIGQALNGKSQGKK